MHIDLVALEEIRTRPATPEEQAHLDACAECRDELDGFRDLAREIKASVRTVAVPASVDRAVLRRTRWTAWVPFAAAAAAVVVMALLVSSSRHPDDLDRDGRVDVADAYLLACKGGDSTRLLKSIVFVGVTVLPPQQGETRFSAIDVFIATGDPLAAWQLEIVTRAKIVGIEGGDGVFAEPPAYDPAALAGGKVVLAGLTTEKELPKGRVRVARLHLEETGATIYTPKLIAAAGLGGKKLDATVELGGVK